jgi:Flp pilus assembly pilin Flp
MTIDEAIEYTLLFGLFCALLVAWLLKDVE